MTITEIAEKQWNKANYEGEMYDAVGFEYNGQFIINPWVDPTGRFSLTTAGAIDTYGIENFADFCGKAAKLIPCKGERIPWALKVCHGIPGYDDLYLVDKNAIYNAII